MDFELLKIGTWAESNDLPWEKERICSGIELQNPSKKGLDSEVPQ
jgi:hypothetical protein